MDTTTEAKRLFKVMLGISKPESEDEVELRDTFAILKTMAENTFSRVTARVKMHDTSAFATIGIHIEREDGKATLHYSNVVIDGDNPEDATALLLDMIDTLIAAIGPADERIEQGSGEDDSQ